MTRRLDLRGERGVALVIVMFVMLVGAGLAGALVSSSVSTLRAGTRDLADKRALEAAQAGLAVGLYHLEQIAKSPSGSFALNCITDQQVAWANTAPHCPAATGNLGNGASYTYYLTPVLGASLTGMTQVATECGPALATHRCLTATGTVNGVTRRIQQRVAGTTLFSIQGILGLKSVLIDSSSSWSGANFQVTSDTASNGPITYGQNVNAPGSPYHCYTGPSGAAPTGCPTVSVPTITTASVDTLPFATTQTTNQNILIGPDYTAANRALSIPAGQTLSLGAGDYNVCSIAMGNGATLSATTGRVRVFVDSPARSGSGCASGGKVAAASTGAHFNSAATTNQLELYLYGTSAPAPFAQSPPSTCGNDFTFNDPTTVASSNVFVYAPNSNVTITSNAYQKWAVVGCSVNYQALSPTAHFDYPPLSTPPTGAVSVVTATWRECTPSFTGDPESGCGY